MKYVSVYTSFLIESLSCLPRHVWGKVQIPYQGTRSNSKSSLTPVSFYQVHLPTFFSLCFTLVTLLSIHLATSHEPWMYHGIPMALQLLFLIEIVIPPPLFFFLVMSFKAQIKYFTVQPSIVIADSCVVFSNFVQFIYMYLHSRTSGWPGGKESTSQWKRCRFNPWVGKIPWRRKWQPSLVFLPGKSHGQKNLAGYSSWGPKGVRHNLATKHNNLNCSTCHIDGTVPSYSCLTLKMDLDWIFLIFVCSSPGVVLDT